MLALLSDLKVRIGMDAFETGADAILNGFLRVASAQLEQFCARQFARESGATVEVTAEALMIAVPRYPIETVTKWETKATEADGYEEQTKVDYLLRAAAGVIVLPQALGSDEVLLRVTYTGGYVLPDATAETGQTALPEEIEDACLEQAAYLYQNRDRLGLQTEWDIGQRYMKYMKEPILPHLMVVMERYRKFQV